MSSTHATLTSCLSIDAGAVRAVVVEEGIESYAIAKDVVAAEDAETPAGCCIWAWGTRVCGLCAVREGEEGRGWRRGWRRRQKVRVAQDGVVGEGNGGVGVGLVVGRFGLDLPHEDVASVDELILVERVVFD